MLLSPPILMASDLKVAWLSAEPKKKALSASRADKKQAFLRVFGSPHVLKININIFLGQKKNGKGRRLGIRMASFSNRIFLQRNIFEKGC